MLSQDRGILGRIAQTDREIIRMKGTLISLPTKITRMKVRGQTKRIQIDKTNLEVVDKSNKIKIMMDKGILRNKILGNKSKIMKDIRKNTVFTKKANKSII